MPIYPQGPMVPATANPISAKARDDSYDAVDISYVYSHG